MAFPEKYRPQTFEDVVGQKSVIKSIESSLANTGDPIKTWMFIGPSGTGKTTIAKILAKKLGASNIGILEINAALFRGIDEARKITSECDSRTIGTKVKVIILDECHQLTKDAQTSLLKTLEDVPDHIRFILATTNPENLLPTITNRCAVNMLEVVSTEDILQNLKRVVKSENLEISDKRLQDIAEAANGCPRESLQLLEQTHSLKDDLAKGFLERAIRSSKDVGERVFSKRICKSMLDRKDWKTISDILRDYLYTRKGSPDELRAGIQNNLAFNLLDVNNPNVASAVRIFPNVVRTSAEMIAAVNQAYNLILGVPIESNTNSTAAKKSAPPPKPKPVFDLKTRTKHFDHQTDNGIM